MNFYRLFLLGTLAIALPVGSFKAQEITRLTPVIVPEATKEVAVQKQSVSRMDTAWASFIRNAKTAKSVLKAEMKELFVEKPKAMVQGLIDEATADQSTIRVAGEFDPYDSESESEDEESDLDSDEEEPLVTTRKSQPSYLKANMRDFSYQPYVRARPPPPRLIYDKRLLYKKRELLYEKL